MAYKRVVTGGHSTSETCSYVFIIFRGSLCLWCLRCLWWWGWLPLFGVCPSEQVKLPSLYLSHPVPTAAPLARWARRGHRSIHSASWNQQGFVKRWRKPRSRFRMVQDGSGVMISREFPMDLHEYVRVRSAMPNALDSWNLERTWKNHVAGKHLNFRKVWPCLKENEQESLNVLMSHVRHVFMHRLSTVDDAHHTQAQIMGIVGLQKQPLVPPRRCRAAQLSWDKPTKFVPTKLLQARPRIPTSVVERRASWRQPATLVLLAQLVMHHHWILCFQSRLLQLARDCAAAIAHRSVCYTEYGALFQLALCLALIWLIPVPTKSGLKTCNMCNLCLQIGHMS